MSLNTSENTPENTSDEKPNAPNTNKQPSLLKAAGLIAVVTVLSKVLGAVRDWQIMNVYGASMASDAYFAAVQLPSFAIVLLGGLGGPFHTVTVSLFTKLLAKTEAEPETASHTAHAQQVASCFVTLTALVFSALSVLTYFFSEPIMRLILQDSPEALIANASTQLKIMSPVMLLGGLIGIFYGLLNVFHSFFWPSLSPAAMSIVMSIALLINPHDETGHLLAWSTLIGTVAQFVIQLPDLHKRQFILKPALPGNQAELIAPLREIGVMLFPAVVGTTIGQLTTYVDMFFTQYLQEGGWTAIVMGNRLFQLPIGILQTALLVPIFPRFTRFVADENWTDLKKNFQMGIVSLWFISIPIMIGIQFYIEPLVKLVFEHGEFDANDTHMVSQALIFLSWSMLPYFARDTLTRVFYAFGDARTPLLVGAIAILLKGALDWLWVVHYDFGVGGITLSTTLITFINMTLLGVLSKKHIQNLGFQQMLAPLLKLTVAGGVMLISLPFLQSMIHPMIELSGLQKRVSMLLEILLAGSISSVLFVLVAYSLKIEEVTYLAQRFLKRKA
jgi:putative peptidoglycan lipid II flippase